MKGKSKLFLFGGVGLVLVVAIAFLCINLLGNKNADDDKSVSGSVSSESLVADAQTTEKPVEDSKGAETSKEDVAVKKEEVESTPEPSAESEPTAEPVGEEETLTGEEEVEGLTGTYVKTFKAIGTHDVKIASLCSGYAAGDTISVTVVVESDGPFTGSIGTTVGKDYTWQQTDFEVTEAGTVTWKFSAPATGDIFQIGIWSIDGSAVGIKSISASITEKGSASAGTGSTSAGLTGSYIKKFTASGTYDINIAAACPDYVAGDTISVSVVLEGDGGFNGSIGTAVGSNYAWQQSDYSTDNAGTVTWNFSAAATGDTVQLGIWYVGGSAVGIKSINVSVTGKGSASAGFDGALQIVTTPQNIKINPKSYCSDFEAGDTIKITASLFSDKYFNGTIGMSNQNGVWKQAGTKECTGGAATWSLTVSDAAESDAELQLWWIEGKVAIKSISVSIVSKGADDGTEDGGEGDDEGTEDGGNTDDGGNTEDGGNTDDGGSSGDGGNVGGGGNTGGESDTTTEPIWGENSVTYTATANDSWWVEQVVEVSRIVGETAAEDIESIGFSSDAVFAVGYVSADGSYKWTDKLTGHTITDMDLNAGEIKLAQGANDGKQHTISWKVNLVGAETPDDGSKVIFQSEEGFASGEWAKNLELSADKFAGLAFDGSEKLVITYASPEGATYAQFKLATINNYTALVDGLNVNVATAPTKQEIELTEDFAKIAADGLMLQGANWIVTEVAIVKEDDSTDTETPDAATNVIFEGEFAAADDWGKNLELTADEFAGLKFDGTEKLVVTYVSIASTGYTQFKLATINNYTAIVDGLGAAMVSTPSDLEFVLTEDYAKIAADGLMFQGAGWIISKITVEKVVPTTSVSIWSGEFAAADDWSKNLELAADKFAGLKFDGSETLMVTYVSNQSTGYTQFKLATINNYIAIVDGLGVATVSTPTELGFELTEDFAKIAADGLMLQGAGWIVTDVSIKSEVTGSASPSAADIVAGL